MKKSRMDLVFKLLLLASAACVARAMVDKLSINPYEIPEGRLTIITPNLVIEISAVKNEFAEALMRSVSSNKKVEDGIEAKNDDIVVGPDNKVVYREVNGMENDEVRIVEMSDEVREWIENRVQDLSYQLSDLLKYVYIPKSDRFKDVAGHVDFLNTYIELTHISRANLPTLKWLERKLMSTEKSVARSLNYMKRWIEWAEKTLQHYERTNSEYQKSMKWRNLLNLLRKIKREQFASKEIQAQIDKILREYIKLNVGKNVHADRSRSSIVEFFDKDTLYANLY